MLYLGTQTLCDEATACYASDARVVVNVPTGLRPSAILIKYDSRYEISLTLSTQTRAWFSSVCQWHLTAKKKKKDLLKTIRRVVADYYTTPCLFYLTHLWMDCVLVHLVRSETSSQTTLNSRLRLSERYYNFRFIHSDRTSERLFDFLLSCKNARHFFFCVRPCFGVTTTSSFGKVWKQWRDRNFSLHASVDYRRFTLPWQRIIDIFLTKRCLHQTKKNVSALRKLL